MSRDGKLSVRLHGPAVTEETTREVGERMADLLHEIVDALLAPTLAKHDEDCTRRGDAAPTSFCTCGLSDGEVAAVLEDKATTCRHDGRAACPRGTPDCDCVRGAA